MRSSTPLPKNVLARGLLGNVVARAVLALAFLFAQQSASLHWLSHALEAAQATASKVVPPSADHCDECLALGALGAAATSQAAALPLASAQHALLSAPIAAPSPAPLRLAFRSRAPPTLG